MMKTIENLFDHYKQIINTILADKMFLLMFVIVFILFLGLVYYTYNKIIKPALNMDHILNKEYRNESNKNTNSDDVLVILFKTEWCPYCKRAMPEWNKFKTYINNLNNTNDNKVTLSIIDCDKEPEIAEKYNIDAYPSIKLIYKGEVYDYDAKPDKDNLVKFLESFTN